MLLTITTTHTPATDLGYLLFKNPARHHTKELSFGTAHLFYPEASAERCTVAVLLDIDPITAPPPVFIGHRIEVNCVHGKQAV